MLNYRLQEIFAKISGSAFLQGAEGLRLQGQRETSPGRCIKIANDAMFDALLFLVARAGRDKAADYLSRVF